VWLKIGSSFGSITKEDEIVWRNPLFEPPPLCIFNQEERTKEESVEVREVEEESSEAREVEETSGVETKVSNTSQERLSVTIVTSSSQSGRSSSSSNMANQGFNP
jgi:hypothetical protein